MQTCASVAYIHERADFPSAPHIINPDMKVPLLRPFIILINDQPDPAVIILPPVPVHHINIPGVVPAHKHRK